MKVSVSNQMPCVLPCVYKNTPNGDFDPIELMGKAISKKLFTPLAQGQSVSIKADGNTVTEDDITQNLVNCMSDTIQVQYEDYMKDIFQHTLTFFDRRLNINSLYATQAAVKAKLPFPSGTTIYTPSTDVIPISKQFLSGLCDWETYFATMAFYTKCNTLGLYFANEAAFNDFKVWVDAQITLLSSGTTLPMDTVKLFKDFQTLTLDGLTESLILRKDSTDNADEFSFARTLVSLIMSYTKQVGSGIYGILPFTVEELFCPKTLVMVNVEKHAHASSKEVADEWNIINKSINMKPTVLNNNKIQKLTSTMRSVQKYKSAANKAANGMTSSAAKARAMKFSKKQPSIENLTKRIARIISKMSFVSKSQNTYSLYKMTFMRPNRRNPDDYNAMGKSASTRYKPDIHIYIDTSGSISEENYQGAIKACITLAKKLNVNLYFNSFSHVISQSTLLKTKDKSTKAIYNQFQKVPKVTGGTEYQQVWEYINASPKRKRELSLMITDFEYTAPNQMVKHPKNLYYIPCSKMDWDCICNSAKYFAQSMTHIDANIRKKLLF